MSANAAGWHALCAGLSARRTVVAVWLGSYRLVMPVTLLTAAVAAFHSGTNYVWGLAVLALLPYVLCVAAAWMRTGRRDGPLVFATVRSRADSRVFRHRAVWPADDECGFSGKLVANVFWLGSPFLGVSTIGVHLANAGGPPGNTAWWVISWMQLDGMAALAILGLLPHAR